MTRRRLELTPQRFQRWWEKFHVDHPGVQVRTVDGAVELHSSDGSSARFTGWYPVGADDDLRARLLEVPGEIGIILIRRGGYSVGFATGVDGADGGVLQEHKTGTRYVQSRTSAGGWSQQRFARRRENQAEGLVRATADHASRILRPLLSARDAERGLVVGGDDLLIEGVLSDPRLERLRELPCREFPDLPDPRFKMLQEVLARSAMVRVTVRNP